MPSFARLSLALCVLTLWSTTALADPPPCTCQNLESLQQEYQNAVYLEGHKRRLAEHLKQVEAAQATLQKTDPTHPNAGDSVGQTSANAGAAYEAANRRLPFPQPKDYKGPAEISMIPGQCQQPINDLNKMRDGSPCEAIADSALAHERAHVDICKSLGTEAYWGRMPSVFALEEAEMYKAQAANLKAELRRVLDVSDVRLSGEWLQTTTGHGIEMVYFYAFETGDISPSSSGRDSWTMTGEGETQNQMQSMRAPEVTCTSTGAVRWSLAVTMKTDGLTFGLDMTSTTLSNDQQVLCNDGIAMAFPTVDVNVKQLAVSQPLVSGDNPLSTAWADVAVAEMASAGMTLSGEPKAVLSVTCEGQ